MRASFLFAAVAVVCLLMPIHGHVYYRNYNDSNCSQEAWEWSFKVGTSPSCVSYAQESLIVLCSSINKTTTLNLSVWGNGKCAHTPVWTINATGPEGGCLPTVEVVNGIKKAPSFSKVNCNASFSTTPFFVHLPPPFLVHRQGLQPLLRGE